MRMWSYIVRRLVLLIPQALVISVVAFMLIRLVPGNPANAILGPTATPEGIAAVEERLGLDKPLPTQYWYYLSDVVSGDLGDARLTGQAVRDDILDRFPATLELITISLVVAVLIFVPMGMYLAIKTTGPLNRITTIYGLLAGAIPEFWLGLILIYVFFFQLDIAPAPLGRLDPGITPPDRITGSYVIDGILQGKWEALRSALSHLIMPVTTLVFVMGGPILKMTRSSMTNVLRGDYVHYARALGLPESQVSRYALRNALPPVVTIVGVLYGFLIGGAVLVETVFSWGGVGQYAVQSIGGSDFAAVQGFVLVASVFSLLVYLAVDLVYIAIDPRIEY